MSEEINNDCDDFKNLTNENFKFEEVEPLSKEDKILQKENEKILKNLERERIKQQKQQEKEELKQLKQAKNEKKDEPDDDLYSNDPTPIIGSSKRQLISKITQYKALFTELKTFKIKKNPTIQELQDY